MSDYAEEFRQLVETMPVGASPATEIAHGRRMLDVLISDYQAEPTRARLVSLIDVMKPANPTAALASIILAAVAEIGSPD